MYTVNAELVRTLMFERGIGVTALARQAQINAITAARVLKDGAIVKGAIIGKLARFFGVDGNTLILKG